MKVTANW